MKKIASIINFVRSVEPRSDDDSYLLPTLREELELCKSYGFKSTVLFQYDALIREDYRELVGSYKNVETGIWLEIVEPLCVDSGIKWTGEYLWDWRVHCNYTSSYTPSERRRIIDTAFNKYKEYYGHYPEVAGSWILDAVTVSYMKEAYGVKAACICRDQYGTDGITLWGGYYNGAYYPSKNNFLCPANTKENQIDLPVFRMLGPDPIHQYDMGLGSPESSQGVCTLEPVYTDGGGNENWVKWYLKENYNDKCLSLAYAQFGQENSFGWESIKNGLPMQMELLSEKIKSGEIELMTLGESGEWFSGSYSLTPAAAMCTDTDWSDENYKSVWYYSRYYRVNIVYQNGAVWIRDLHVFDEGFTEQFIDSANKSKACGNFNLPVMDGFRFSKENVRAGIFPFKNGGVLCENADFLSETAGENRIKIICGSISFLLVPEKLYISCSDPKVRLKFVCADVSYLPYREIENKKMKLSFSGFSDKEYEYMVRLSKGVFEHDGGDMEIVPENGEAEMIFNE